MGDVSPRAYYDRQLRVPGWGPEGQTTLGKATVLVVGVGGLGCPALEALARAGVGRLVFCDPDRVEASNLPRQTLFTVDDVGRPKVEAAAQALARSNPWITLVPRPVRVEESNVRALVEGADLVVEGSDNFATKFLVHDACRSAAKPLVLASLYQWEAQVAAFPFHRPHPGCWRCLYPVAPEDGCVGVCADVGVAGALAGMAGNLQALAAVRLLLGLEGPEGCRQWVFDAAEWSPRELKWKPDPACACHQGPGHWEWLRAPSAPSHQEIDWDEVDFLKDPVLVDLRDPSEILPGEPEALARMGELIQAPWSRWQTSAPLWHPARTYVLFCARGSRSRAALDTVPPGVQAVSVRGGMGARSP